MHEENQKEIQKLDRKMKIKIDETATIYQKHLPAFNDALDKFLEEWEDKGV